MFRNMLKRITSVALAFALIGAGSTIEMTNNSQEAVLHTAHASPQSKFIQGTEHPCGRYTYTETRPIVVHLDNIGYTGTLYTECTCCSICGKTIQANWPY